MKEIKRQSQLDIAIQAKGLKKKAIASFLGMTAQTFSAVISGEKTLPDKDKYKLSIILSKPQEELFPENSP